MKIVVVVFSLFYVFFSGHLVQAQEASLLEQLVSTKAYSTAHERGNTHMVVFSGMFRPLTHAHVTKGMTVGELQNQIERQRLSYRHDMQKFLLAELEFAQKEQGVNNPHIVVVAHEDVVPSWNNKELAKGEMDVRGILSDLQKENAKFENVEVVTQKDSIPTREQNAKVVGPILKAIQLLNQSTQRATVAHHIMEPVAAINVQLDFMVASSVLKMAERMRLNVRATGDKIITKVVIPGLLYRFQHLFSGAGSSAITVSPETKVRMREGELVRERTSPIPLVEYAEQPLSPETRTMLTENYVTDVESRQKLIFDLILQQEGPRIADQREVYRGMLANLEIHNLGLYRELTQLSEQVRIVELGVENVADAELQQKKEKINLIRAGIHHNTLIGNLINDLRLNFIEMELKDKFEGSVKTFFDLSSPVNGQTGLAEGIIQNAKDAQEIHERMRAIRENYRYAKIRVKGR